MQPTPTAAPTLAAFAATHAFRLMPDAQRLCSQRARLTAAGRASIELERGARLYRAPGQLSISQRVRRAPPYPGPPVEKGALEHRAPAAYPGRRQPRQLPASLRPFNDGVSRWTP